MREFLSAFRVFRKAPGFAATVIVTLALGIGANTAIFTLVHAVLLRSLPVQDPKALYRLGDQALTGQYGGFPDSTRGGDFSVFSYPLYKHLVETVPALHDTAAMESGGDGMNVRQGSAPARAQVIEFVSGNYFSTLGIGTFAGRTFAVADDTPSSTPVAVVSYASWQANYASDPRIVGQTLTFQGKPVTVVGVAPAGFFGDRLNANPPDFWLPLAIETALDGGLTVLQKPDINWLNLIARVPKGVQPAMLAEQVSIELRHWLATLPNPSESTTPAVLARQHVVVVPGGSGIQVLQQQESKGLYLLTGICLLVLLVACANVANLLLARSASQRADVALRIALGASRIRLLRRMMTESMVLACSGGVVGLVFAYGCTRLILALAFPDAPQLPISANPSLPVLAFALFLSVLTGVVFGIIPAWNASRADPAEALRGVNRSTRDRASLPQRALVIFQAALSLLLLVSAGMFTRSLSNLQHQDLGLQTASRYVVHFDPQGAGYTTATLPALYTALHDRFAAIPGVADVGLALYTPLEQSSFGTEVQIEGHPDRLGKSALWDRVSEGYFASIGQPVLQGRAFTEDDTATSQRVAVVNRTFAERYFPGQSALGHRFLLGQKADAAADGVEIVGVVADTKYIEPDQATDPMFFLAVSQFRTLPSAQAATADADRSAFLNALVLHFKVPPANVDALVRSTFAEINADLPVNKLQTFGYQISGNFSENVLLARLATLFGLLALLLAAIGLYGITSYQVSRRTNEIGVRMALGATRGNVLRTVLQGALGQVGIGLLIGLPLAILGAHSIASQLYNVHSYDPLSLVLSVAALVAAAVLAGILPARRAASIEPVNALRSE